MTDTIKAPKPDHADNCKHSDCAGECCVREECANQPQGRRPRVGNWVHTRDSGGWTGRPVCATIYDDDEVPPRFFVERMRQTYYLCERGVTWKFTGDEEPAKQPTQDRRVEPTNKAEVIFAAKTDERVNAVRLEMLDQMEQVCKERNQFKRERDESRRVRDECRVSHDHMAGLLAEAQRERDGYKDSNESAMRAWGSARAEVDRLTKELHTERESGRQAVEKMLALAGTCEVLTARNAELVEALQIIAGMPANTYEEQQRLLVVKAILAAPCSSVHTVDIFASKVNTGIGNS